MGYPNNIKKLQKARGWTIDQAAAAAGMSRGNYIKVERGEVRLNSTSLEKLARGFGVSKAEILASPEKAQVVGYALAGGDTITFGEGQGPFDEVDAPLWANEKTVAVRIRGTSLGRLLDGWLAFYDDRRDPPDETTIGSLCICGLADGRVVIKLLRRGSRAGLFHLESETEPTMFDVQVAWAAQVLEMRPK
jgi:transcriptional regulator with XRE-family HTH domain